MPVGIPDFEMNGYDYNSARSYYYPNYDSSYSRDEPYRRDLEPYRRDDPYRPEDRHDTRRDDLDSHYISHPVEDYKGYDSRLGGGSEYSTFEVDHLATFSASQYEALKPDVGLSKLATMANTSGIWTMKCILMIERDCLVIHEKGTGGELERFPFAALRNPVAISKPDKREVYNNLVLLTVVDNSGNRDSQAHMHIFLAGSVPAQEIVNEIISAKDGRPLSHVNTRIPPPPNQPAPEPPNHVRDKVNSFERNMREADRHQDPVGYSTAAVRDQDVESVLSEKTEKDVQLLNHCFDDIEKFVSRLQKAAESYKELERMKKEKSHKGKKARQELEEKLELTAQPPKGQDYTDIFQKFKLSFNLLAKLKAHIHDPNAPELVHFLFTPLSLIYEASRDPSQGNRDLAASVVSPLLTREAKELLLNCLTSKETDLWMSLGDAWITSRDKWKHFVPPYTPRFYNGWHPAPSLDEMQGAQTPAASHTYISPPMRPFDEPPPNVEPRRPMERPVMGPEIKKPGPRYVPNPQLPPEDSNDQFHEDLRKKGAKICSVSHSRDKKHQKELTVAKGEILEVLDDTRNWWKLRNCKGEIGHAPFTILHKLNNNGYNDGYASTVHSFQTSSF